MAPILISSLSRRSLLATLAVAFPPAVIRRRRAFAAAADLDRVRLGAVSEVVLPSRIGFAGRMAAVDGFLRWVAGYRGGAELLHGYGSAEIRRTPPSPATRWAAQLAELDLVAVRRFGHPFAETSLTDRTGLIVAALESEAGPDLPAIARARHVALGLLAHWAESPPATDLAYRARIGRLGCRPLAENPDRPAGWDGP